jgi:hypothetical protein
MGTPEDIATVIVFLATDEARGSLSVPRSSRTAAYQSAYDSIRLTSDKPGAQIIDGNSGRLNLIYLPRKTLEKRNGCGVISRGRSS